MTDTGSRLGRLLYYIVMVLIALAVLTGIVAAIGLVVAIVAPDLWPRNAVIRVDGGPPLSLLTPQERAIACVAILGAVALATMVLGPLFGLMRSAADRMPFVAANVRRLRLIGGAFALYAAIRVVVPLVLPTDLARQMQLEGPTLDMGPILMALVMLVLAEVFRAGVALREEAEGTI